MTWWQIVCTALLFGVPAVFWLSVIFNAVLGWPPRCPFRCPEPHVYYQEFSFGVADGYVEYVEEIESEQEAERAKKCAEWREKYPTCWRKLLHKLLII